LYAANPLLSPNCSQTGAIAPGQTYNCDGTVKTYGQPDFPTTMTFFSSTPPIFSTQCTGMPVNNATGQALTISMPYNCPAPLVIPDTVTGRIPGSFCGVPCPLPIFTDEQYHQMDIVFIVSSWLSAITLSFVSLTWCIFPQKRKQHLVLLFNATLAVLAIFIWISALQAHHSGKHVSAEMCKNNAELFNGKDGGWCETQAYVSGALTTAGELFWWATSMELWLQIAMEYRPAPESFEYKMIHGFYIAWAFGAPIVMFSLMEPNGNLGGGDVSMPVCMLNSRGSNVNYEYFWYYFMAVFGAHGFINIIWIMIKLVDSSRKTGQNQWRVYLRPLIFLWCFFLLFLSIASYRLWGYENVGKWNASAAQWVECLLITQYTVPGTVCGDTPKEVPSFSTTTYIAFIIGIQGFIESIIYGTVPDIYTLWYKKCLSWGCTCCEESNEKSQADSTGGTVQSQTAAASRAMSTTSKDIEMKPKGDRV